MANASGESAVTSRGALRALAVSESVSDSYDSFMGSSRLRTTVLRTSKRVNQSFNGEAFVPTYFLFGQFWESLMRAVLLLLCLLPLACHNTHEEGQNQLASATAAPPPTAASSDLDPQRCQYLSTSEASALTGLPFVSGVPDRKCQWVDAKGSVVLTVSMTDARTHYDKELKIFPNHQDLPGIGDQAFVMGPVIGVRMGSRFFTLSGIVTANPHSVTTDKLVTAARAIGARLSS